MVARVIPVDPFDLVIFGGTGDLARRKILPGLYRRCLAGQMPDGARIIGAARSDLDAAGYREMIAAAIAEFAPEISRDTSCMDRFMASLHYVQVDARGEGGWSELKSLIREDVVRAFYFSVGPGLFGDLAERLHTHGIAGPDDRVVVEKPFGRDLASARDLNDTLSQHLILGLIRSDG